MIQDIVAQALQQRVPLSSQETDLLLADLVKERARLNERFDKINATGRGNMGTLYHKLLLQGSTEDVAEMEAECNRLVIERNQLKAKEEALRNRRREALIDEAAAMLPKLQAALVAKVEAAEAAQRVLDAALAEIGTAYQAVVLARGQCSSSGLPPTANATLDTMSRLDALSRFVTPGPAMGPWSTTRTGHAENLGLDLPDVAEVEVHQADTPMAA